MKIVLWGISGNSSEDQNAEINSLHQLLVIQVGSEKNRVNLQNANLIIAHDGLPNGFRKGDNTWVIYTSMKKGDSPPRDISQLGKISWNTLLENLRAFLTHSKSLTSLQIEDIEVLYRIDPVLERLLEPFRGLSPFSGLTDICIDSRGMELTVSQAKEFLLEYCKSIEPNPR